MVTIKAHAKLNLYLHVTGKKNEQFHSLDSLAVFCDQIYDTITLKSADNFSCKNTGPYASKIDNNTIEKIFKRITPYLSSKRFSLDLRKNIPIGAGLGGGSSDAANFIKLLQKENILHIETNTLNNILLEVGSDIPICYHNKAAYFTGQGEHISTVNNFPKIFAVVLFPEITLMTKDIFSAGFKKYLPENPQRLTFTHYKDVLSFLKNKENTLYQNSLQIAPEIANYISEIRNQDGCNFARMTGSGSAIFGLFKTKNQAINAEKNLKNKYNFFIKYTGLF